MAGHIVLSMVAVGMLAGGASSGQSEGSAERVVMAYSTACKHGLYRQPSEGRYAVMLFCDDAASSHIGVVCYAAGCESSAENPGPWELNRRFWQEGDWTDDVTGFAWDVTGECLYVSTDGIYGTGDVFVLNLRRQRYEKLPLRLDGVLPPRGRYGSQLKQLDPAGKLLRYEVEYFDARRDRTVTESKTVPLAGCSGGA